jgi:poly(3-hydroxybutyrate) depolymerase
MNLLAIDCTECPLTVASTNAHRTVVKCGAQWQKSGEQIVALIAETLQDLQIKPSNLNAVALSSGPRLIYRLAHRHCDCKRALFRARPSAGYDSNL